MRTAIVAFACAGLGLTLGLLLRPTAPSSVAAPARVESASAPSLESALDRAQLASLIRGAVRDELARSRVPTLATVGAAPVKPDEPAPAPSREQLQARDDATALVAAARHAGRWTDGDRQRLREVVSQLDGDAHDQLLHELIPAINRQEIKLETHGAPF